MTQDLGWDGPEGTIKEVTVSITKSVKLHGDLISITLGETRTLNSASESDGIIVRDGVANLLQEQIASLLKEAVAKHGDVLPTPVTPGYVQRPAAPAYTGTQVAGPAYSGSGAAAVAAVANGAPVSAGAWMSVPSRFGDGDIRFLPTSVYPSAQLENEVSNFLLGRNLNPSFFKTWDNRPGQRGLEAGVPNGAVAAVKLSDGAPGKEQIGNNAAARVKFNNDGSLYIWLTKEFEAALKFVGAALAPAGGVPQAYAAPVSSEDETGGF